MNVVPRWLLSALLVVGAGLFVVGTTSEDGDPHSDVVAAVEGSPEAEAAEGASAEGGSAEVPTATESSEGTILGVNRESAGLVTAGAVISVALAVIAWAVRRRVVFAIIAAVAALFAIFDIAEVAHQVDVAKTGLAVLAGAVTAVHVAAAAVAGWCWRTAT